MVSGWEGVVAKCGAGKICWVSSVAVLINRSIGGTQDHLELSAIHSNKAVVIVLGVLLWIQSSSCLGIFVAEVLMGEDDEQ